METGMDITLWHPVVFVVYAVILVLPFWTITTKAGYSGWLSLLVMIPLANIIFLYFLGFSNWPILRRET